jgi:hypothetical protein
VMKMNDDYVLCVQCGHKKVLKKDLEKHENSKKHIEYGKLQWMLHNLGQVGWTVNKFLKVLERLKKEKEERKYE